MTLASELIGDWSLSVGHLSVREAALDAEAQCLKGHQPALPLLPRALSSFVPNVLETQAFASVRNGIFRSAPVLFLCPRRFST